MFDLTEKKEKSLFDLILADESEPACPTCGKLLSQVYDNGFLGCEECYKVFNEPIRQALAAMHQTSRHTGKTL